MTDKKWYDNNYLWIKNFQPNNFIIKFNSINIS